MKKPSPKKSALHPAFQQLEALDATAQTAPAPTVPKLPGDNRDDRDNRPPLPHEEWDFRDCPDWQLAFCCSYEYARESTTICELAAKDWQDIQDTYRRQRDNPGTPIPVTGPFGKFGLHHDLANLLLTLRKYFPAKPWLVIPNEERVDVLTRYCHWLPTGDFDTDPHNKKRKQIVESGKIGLPLATVPAATLQADGVLKNTLTRMEQGSPVTYAVFKIPWSWSDKKLADAMKQWAFANRPTDAKPKGSGATNWGDILKPLGALRLLRRYTWEQAQIETAEALTGSVHGKPLYNGLASWNRARNQAQKKLEAFEKTHVGVPQVAAKKSF